MTVVPGAGPTPLPAVLANVRTPASFNPSTFVDLLRCPLSIIHGLPESELLPPSARAILGTIIHDVMHSVRSHTFRSREELSNALEITFEEFLEATESRLSADPGTRSLVPLRPAVGRSAWKNRLARMRAWAAGPALDAHGLGGPNGRIASHHERLPFRLPLSATTHIPEGSEVQLAVPSLRLFGRADSISRDSDGTVHVVDFKSGRVDDRNEPDERYTLQLRLYGLMLENIEPGVRLRLWIEGAERVEVPWDDARRAATLASLEEISAQLPAGDALNAVDLAREGPQCWRCRARHRCPRYREIAPTWWRNVSTDGSVAPFDLWGAVFGIRVAGERLAELELNDAAGRTVRISGLEAWLGDGDLHPGDDVWLFNLQPNETLPHHGAYTHPLNFHGSPPSRGWPPALRLRVYVGENAAPSMSTRGTEP
jgi:hypothetical protein